MTFQPTLADPEDRKMNRMANHARTNMVTQSYGRYKAEKPTKMGAEIGPQARKTHIVGSNISHQSKKPWHRQVKKVEEKLALVQQEKEEDTEISVGSNKCHRDRLNMISEMMEGHSQKVVNVVLE